MIVQNINGTDYRLPSGMSDFKRQIYVHLIDWKWKNITKEPGCGVYRGRQIHYDAILPEGMIDDLRMVYPPIVDELRQHRKKNDFKLHTFFNHMASSQAANVNLFLPILLHPYANVVLAGVKNDFATLATDQFDNGYCLEFWGGNFGINKSDKGPLADKSPTAGTDSDIAIAYRNHKGELCLWLIEHKLTEAEFTTCGGFKSKGRKKRPNCNCTRSFSEILKDKNTCYHHDVRHQRYWDITERNQGIFINHGKHGQCPFQGGMNQLWRNQLLALAIEQDEREPFKHAHFSVVHHPKNETLDGSLADYKELIGNSPKFSVFTSGDFLRPAEALQDDSLGAWARWYRDLYML